MSHTESALSIEPIVKTVLVQVPPERAFEVFTRGMGRWWLPHFSISPTRAPIADVLVEPREGGRWYERGEDGSECDWGRVLAWEPPHRVLLDWQIDGMFRFNPALHTELEIRFVPEGPAATRVVLEHRHLERFGEHAIDARARMDGGWGSLLERFAGAAVPAEHDGRGG